MVFAYNMIYNKEILIVDFYQNLAKNQIKKNQIINSLKSYKNT